ncbi:hypothetical protein AAG570_013265 [Ranatra chinensis]|uniref:Peptidase A2 domain-containing protein n=1 Tax=Ranatra chinensis TaxID=642074 RepID=A0ABD0YUT5_9HEMI
MQEILSIRADSADDEQFASAADKIAEVNDCSTSPQAAQPSSSLMPVTPATENVTIPESDPGFVSARTSISTLEEFEEIPRGICVLQDYEDRQELKDKEELEPVHPTTPSQIRLFLSLFMCVSEWDIISVGTGRNKAKGITRTISGVPTAQRNKRLQKGGHIEKSRGDCTEGLKANKTVGYKNLDLLTNLLTRRRTRSVNTSVKYSAQINTDSPAAVLVEVRSRCTEMITSVHIQGNGKQTQAADNAESVAHNHQCRLFLRDLNSGTNFLVDTGAFISALLKKFQITTQSGTALYAANGTKINTYGTITALVDFGLRRPFRWTYILADIQHPIIGAEFLINFGLFVDLRRARLIDEETGLATHGKSVHVASPTIHTIPGHGPYDHILREFPQSPGHRDSNEITERLSQPD